MDGYDTLTSPSAVHASPGTAPSPDAERMPAPFPVRPLEVPGQGKSKKAAKKAAKAEEEKGEDDYDSDNGRPLPANSPSAVADAFNARGFEAEGAELGDGPISPSADFDPNLCSPSANGPSPNFDGPAHLQQHAAQRSKELAAKSKQQQGVVTQSGVSRFPQKTFEYKESADGTLCVPTEVITASHSFPARINNKVDFATMRQFLTSPLPPNVRFQCVFIRNRSGLKNRLFPRYELYFEATKTFLLSSKKKTSNKTSNYVMSMSKKNVNNHSVEYLGKVRGNFSGSEYVLYDDGLNPKYIAEKGQVNSVEGSGRQRTLREEIGAVFYTPNIMGSTPRKLQAVIPTVTVTKQAHVVKVEKETEGAATAVSDSAPGADGKAKEVPTIQPSVMRRASWADTGKNASIVNRYKALHTSGSSSSSSSHEAVMAQANVDDEMMTSCINKEPVWNTKIGAYALNFGGRAKIASVKNFQMVKPTEPDYVMLQFGKMGKDVFALDVQHPLSPLQAFGIALSGVDSKLVSD